MTLWKYVNAIDIDAWYFYLDMGEICHIWTTAILPLFSVKDTLFYWNTNQKNGFVKKKNTRLPRIDFQLSLSTWIELFLCNFFLLKVRELYKTELSCHIFIYISESICLLGIFSPRISWLPSVLLILRIYF